MIDESVKSIDIKSILQALRTTTNSRKSTSFRNMAGCSRINREGKSNDIHQH